MAMTNEEIKQAKILSIVLAGGLLGLYWFMFRPNAKLTADIEAPNIAEMDSAITAESTVVDSIRNLLRSTSSEEMETRIASYNGALGVMRRLVPQNNDVPALLENIGQIATRRGVRILDFNPQPEAQVGPYSVQTWSVDLLGGYDAVGEWLADVASLPQIMVPNRVSLSVPDASEVPTDLLLDPTTTVIRATLRLKTFVNMGQVAVPTTGAAEGDPSASP
ncbi:MAG: type 4a pilus biogenesis protein PilO [Gemmatimonadales bacterium]